MSDYETYMPEIQRERARERVRKIDEKLAMSRRMYARDREFAEKFPHLATGERRGTVPFFPNVSKPTCAMPVDMRLFRGVEVHADPDWNRRRREAYAKAKAKGRRREGEGEGEGEGER